MSAVVSLSVCDSLEHWTDCLICSVPLTYYLEKEISLTSSEILQCNSSLELWTDCLQLVIFYDVRFEESNVFDFILYYPWKELT